MKELKEINFEKYISDCLMDTLKQRTQTQAALLRECHTSLISHVVTGKVEV